MQINNHTPRCFNGNTPTIIYHHMPKYFNNKTRKIASTDYVILTSSNNFSNKSVFFFPLYSLVLWIPVHLAKSTHLEKGRKNKIHKSFSEKPGVWKECNKVLRSLRLMKKSYINDPKKVLPVRTTKQIALNANLCLCSKGSSILCSITPASTWYLIKAENYFITKKFVVIVKKDSH